MPKMTVEGTVRLQYLKDHLERWAAAKPELVRGALNEGALVMKREVLRRMDMKLHHRSRKLRSSIATHVVMSGGIFDASVFSKPDAHGLQPMKLRALERGSFRMHPGNIPYLLFGGRPRFISIAKAQELERRGKFTPRTRGPYAIRLPKKPMFKPAFHAKKETVVRLVLQRIMDGFKRTA